MPPGAAGTARRFLKKGFSRLLKKLLLQPLKNRPHSINLIHHNLSPSHDEIYPLGWFLWLLKGSDVRNLRPIYDINVGVVAWSQVTPAF